MTCPPAGDVTEGVLVALAGRACGGTCGNTTKGGGATMIAAAGGGGPGSVASGIASIGGASTAGCGAEAPEAVAAMFATAGSGAEAVGRRRSSAASSLASCSPLDELAISRPNPSTTRSIASVSSGVERRVPARSSTRRSSSLWARRLTRIMPTMPAAPFIVCASRKIPSMVDWSSGADSSASSPEAMRSRWPLASSTNNGRNSSSSSPVSNPAGSSPAPPHRRAPRGVRHCCTHRARQAGCRVRPAPRSRRRSAILPRPGRPCPFRR